MDNQSCTNNAMGKFSLIGALVSGSSYQVLRLDRYLNTSKQTSYMRVHARS